MLNLEEAARIPGQIETVERELLYRLSHTIELQPGEAVVEGDVPVVVEIGRQASIASGR
jgi:hypothetical protein